MSKPKRNRNRVAEEAEPPASPTGAIQLALFVLALVCYGYFYQAGGWNQNCRFDLTRALVENHSFKIDPTHENTGDKALRDSHYYCEKAPLVSFLGAPAHAAARLVIGAEATDRQLNGAAYAATVTAVSLPSALGVVIFFRLIVAMGLGLVAATWSSVAWSLGTMAFPYSTSLYGHQVCAVLLLLSAYLLFGAATNLEKRGRARMLVAGAALGLAFAAEYAGALGIGCLLVYALYSLRGKRPLLWLALGAAISLVPLLAYHASAFGSPFSLAYRYSIHRVRHAGFFMGIGGPSPRALYGILFSEYRGLFVSAPWLLTAAPGFLALLRRERTRAIALTAAGVCGTYVWLNSSLPDWRAGWGFGPRFIIASLPFWALLAAGCWTPIRRSVGIRRSWLTGGLLAAVVVSVAMMLVATAVGPEVPGTVLMPFREYLAPKFATGLLAINTQSIDSLRPGTTSAAWNWGQIAGLTGLWSLVPLFGATLPLFEFLRRRVGWGNRRHGS